MLCNFAKGLLALLTSHFQVEQRVYLQYCADDGALLSQLNSVHSSRGNFKPFRPTMAQSATTSKQKPSKPLGKLVHAVGTNDAARPNPPVPISDVSAARNQTTQTSDVLPSHTPTANDVRTHPIPRCLACGQKWGAFGHQSL